MGHHSCTSRCQHFFVFFLKNTPPLHAPICTSHRADLEHTNKKGLTPLQLAVRSGNLGVTEELLTRGARPNVKSKAGLCLRCLASSMGHGYLVVSSRRR